MDYREADRTIRTFKRIRQDWIEILVKNPEHSEAPSHILRINAKIELMRTMRHYPDDYEGDYE